MSADIERQRERFEADPDEVATFEALEEHDFLAGSWQALIDLYEHRLTAPSLREDPAARAAVLFRLGQVWEERRADGERARESYERALHADSGHRPSLRRLRALHTAQGRWEVALQLADLEAELPMPPAERAELLAESGAIWHDQLEQPEPAAGLFARALRDDAEHRGALLGLARASESLGRASEAASAWERLAALARGSERARALASQARLVGGPLADPERALELYRRAHAEDPDDPDALEALAAHALQRGQWSLLVDLAERRFARAEDDERRVAVALEAGRVLLAQLGDARAARPWLARAAEHGPTNPSVFQALADAERAAGDDAALLSHLERVIELCGDATPISALLESAALLAERGDDDAAVARLQRALAREPEDVLVVEALSDALARTGRDEELADVLERRAALAIGDPATRAGVLTELGTLHLECLDNPEAARHAYERALESDPSAPGLTAALGQLYRKSEAWDELRSLLATASRSAPPAERVGVLCELAALESERFGDREAAMRACESALELEPTAVVAHRRLQALAAQSGDEDTLLRALEREAEVTSHRARLASLVPRLAQGLEKRGRPEDALRWLEHWAEAGGADARALGECARLYESLGRDAEFVSALERLDPLLPRGSQAASRRRLAAHHAAAGRVEAAIRSYESALESDPHDIDALEALIVQLERADRVEDLARARRWLAEILPPHRRALCLDALATLLDGRLGDVDGAIDALAQLRDEPGAPDDVEARLEELLERAGRYPELAVRLRARSHALQSGSPDALALDLRRASVLVDHLGRYEEAAAVFREVRSLVPDSREARDGLERALRAAAEPGPLAAFLGERVAEEIDPETRDRLALERAVLLEDVLGRDEEARALYETLRNAADPVVSGQAVERLECVLERLGAWAALREHLEAALADAGPDERAARHERLAQLCRERLDDRDGAIAHLEAAAAQRPGEARLWRELAALHESAGDARALVEALEAELATGPDPERELALRARAAEQLREGDPERARVHYERVLALEPAHPTAGEFLIEHWEREGRVDAVVALLEGRLAALDGAPRDPDGGWQSKRASLRLRIAGLREQRLDDLDGAVAALEPALGELGPEPVVAEPLADLYQRAGYTDDLIALCRDAAARSAQGPERAGWFVRLGDALRRGDDLRESAAAYRQALTERPDDREVQAVLRDLYRRLDEPRALAALLEEQLSQLGGPEEIPVRLELAELLAGPLTSPGDALPQLRRVLELEPGHGGARARALELAEGAGRRDLVLELLAQALARPQAPAARAALLCRRGRLLAGDAGRLEEAAAALREALSLDPRVEGARAELRRVLELLGDWEAVLQCLYQEARDAEPDARAAIFERAVEIAWEHLSPDHALPWLERLRVERPDDAGVPARVAAVHRRARRFEALLRALDEQLACTPSAAGRRDLYVERALVLERELDSPARAAAELEAAHRAVRDDREVLQRLEQLYRGLARTRERVRVVEKLIPTAEPSERQTLLCEAAALHRGPGGEPQRAVVHLLTAVAEAPRQGPLRAELLRALGDALADQGPPDAWARCAEEELRALDSRAPVFAERRRALQRALALAYERELGRPDAALRHLRELLDDDPDPGPGAELERAALRLLRAAGSWSELETRLVAHVEREPGDADTWLELARLRDERLRRPAAAADAYRRALELDPACRPALRGLRGAAERLGDWPEVARALEAEVAEVEPGPGARAALLQRLGDVCWHRLGSTTRASRAYAASLEADPANLAALRSFEKLLESMEDWRGALELYDSEIEALGEREPERRREVWRHMAALARDQLDDAERARRAWARAAELGPLAPDEQLALAELHARCGDDAAFCEALARWCDDPAAGAEARDHLRLAEALEGIGRAAEAKERAERALACDERHAPAWAVAARLREATGDRDGAGEALARAAALRPDGEAAGHLLRAAELAGERDPRQAAERLRAAVERDPGNARAQARLACVAEALGAWDEALAAAGRALDLAPADDSDAADATRVALAGARAACRLDAPEEAARFYAAVLAGDPDHAEALAGKGETLARLGDLAGARRALEARLALPAAEAASGERARQLALLGHCLVDAREHEAARERFEEALALEAGLDDAHAGLVDLHRQAGSRDEGVACLERWADCAPGPAERAERLMQAARWELESPDGAGRAERHLRDVLEVDPNAAPAWRQLAELLWGAERWEEALDVASHALEGATLGDERGPVALVRARALERRIRERGERGEREAAEAYAEAAEADPRCVEAALARARLLRGLGAWRESADSLRAFAARHPGGDPGGLAEVHHQLGRLLAGPLEDLEGGIAAYRRAVALEPERGESRAALAELLAHSPEHWREAVGHHRERLAADPACASALRALVAVARARSGPEAAAGGLAILRALGAASPAEQEEASPGNAPPARRLDDPLAEKLRRLVHEARDELAAALDASQQVAPAAASDPHAAFRDAVLDAEGELGAPALVPLPDAELAEVLTLTASLALEPDSVRGEGRLVNALTSAIGRRARRRLRRLLGETPLERIAGVDFAAWRNDLRALAACVAMDATGCDLRTALVSLLCDEPAGAAPATRHLGEEADLTPLLAASPRARALLRRVVDGWCRSL